MLGDLPPELLPITEHGMKLLVDIQQGTRPVSTSTSATAAARNYSAGRRVLNCFSYTGAFAVSALMGGCAQVISVDTSQAALDIARQNVELNKLDLNKAEFVRDDVFSCCALPHLWREIRSDHHGSAEVRREQNQLASACRGYKDINMLALQLLNPGGILLSFSCSGLMPTDLFQKILADAAVDAGRDVQFIEQFRQAADHPVIATYPEGCT
ncbi:class I SAM-dependent methyltransferase [Serratia marcescens]|uniref:Class I SAM-dependent methyltransferase n=1 Tax=Serratia marcescens TaxID=615 RepID=A0A939NJX0_SERMA|nr:class I SAM-dependent methyltransferase [Serratia marcescens]